MKDRYIQLYVYTQLLYSIKVIQMKSRIIIILIICLAAVQACKTAQVSEKENKDTLKEISVVQNGKEFKLLGEDCEILIDRDVFSIRFRNKRYDSENKKFYSARVAAFVNRLELQEVKSGMSKSEIKCFSPGTGISPSRSGKYESLFIGKGGHHYLVYENSESKRLKKIDEKDDLLTLEFEINRLFQNGEDEKMSDTELNEFYLAILIDRNLNNVVDEGELKRVTVRIK